MIIITINRLLLQTISYCLFLENIKVTQKCITSVGTGDSHYICFHYMHFCMSVVLFQCHEEHQCPIHSHGKSCCKYPVSCAWSFPYLRHYSALVSFHSSTMPSVHSVHFMFYALTAYAVIFRNTTPVYNKSHLYR
jgi:hypothetical protein